jgi:hypothetical protein
MMDIASGHRETYDRNEYTLAIFLLLLVPWKPSLS